MYKTRLIQNLFLALVFMCTAPELSAQCNTNISICTPGVAGPFTFNTPGTPVSSCLDFFGPSVSYITLHITSGGPLELLIDGDATTGFIDVAIFDVPSGMDPCVAIQDNANEIGCNYADASSGCNQFGTAFGCASSVPAPSVSAGDELMIVVENWSGAAFNFTLELGGTGAQTGPPDPTITPMAPMLDTDPSALLTAAAGGGTWSASCGACIDAGTGMFDPGVAGPGVHSVCYDIGSAPCDAQDCRNVTVQLALAVELKEFDAVCSEDEVLLEWETLSEYECDYFLVEKSRDGVHFQLAGSVPGHGTTTKSQEYEFSEDFDGDNNYYRLIEVDYDGKRMELGAKHVDCGRPEVMIHPNPGVDKVIVNYSKFDPRSVTIQVFDNVGRLVMTVPGELDGEVELSIDHLSSQLYTVIVRDVFTQKSQRFTKL